MATLLDEILGELNSSTTRRSCKCNKQTGACGCIECCAKKVSSGGRHKTWKERRNERLLTGKRKTNTVRQQASPVAQEYEWEAPAAAPERHVILVAGHNWENPSHKFISYCFNRSKRLVAKDKTLRFTIFDFSTGKVIFGTWVKTKIEWTTLKTYKAITKAHYTKSGSHYVFSACDSEVLSITEIYKYIKAIGRAKPHTIAELSFFAHGWMGGPILVDSYDRYRGDNYRPERDSCDKDPRVFKDFEDPNMSMSELSEFRSAFTNDAFVWIWGCAFTTSYFQVLHQVLVSKAYRSAYPKAIADATMFSFKFNSVQAGDFFKGDTEFFPPMNAGGTYPLSFTRSFKDIKEYIQRGLFDTYASSIASAAQVPCRSAFLGTYADYEKNVSLPLMLIPRKKPPYSDNFSSYINFYKIYLGKSEDPENRGYGIYLP